MELRNVSIEITEIKSFIADLKAVIEESKVIKQELKGFFNRGICKLEQEKRIHQFIMLALFALSLGLLAIHEMMYRVRLRYHYVRYLTSLGDDKQ